MKILLDTHIFLWFISGDPRLLPTVQDAICDPDSVIQLAKLPPLHRDPFDRMLICQALQHGLTIATVDPAIRAYSVNVL